MNNQSLMRKQLDRQLNDWQELCQHYARPRAGWIKTLRVALNMSVAQLASRLGLSRARVNKLENAETHDAVTLRTLKEAANALECELIYIIVPKKGSSLESIIKARAEQIAKERVARVAHSMSLEAQTVNRDTLNKQQKEIVKSLLENLDKHFWTDETRS